MTCNPFLMHCDIFCATLPTCSMHDVVTSSSSPLSDVPGFLQHLRPVACNTFLIRCNIFLLVSKLHDLPDTLSPRLTVTCQMLLIRWSNFFKWVQTCSWYIATYSWYVETSSAKWTCNSYDRIKMSCSSSLSDLLQSYWKTSMSLSIGAASHISQT